MQGHGLESLCKLPAKDDKLVLGFVNAVQLREAIVLSAPYGG